MKKRIWLLLAVLLLVTVISMTLISCDNLKDDEFDYSRLNLTGTYVSVVNMPSGTAKVILKLFSQNTYSLYLEIRAANYDFGYITETGVFSYTPIKEKSNGTKAAITIMLSGNESVGYLGETIYVKAGYVTGNLLKDFVWVYAVKNDDSTQMSYLNFNTGVSYTMSYAPFTYSVVYKASEGGMIQGNTSQNVTDGADASEVTAVEDEDYTFKRWSDGVTEPKRKDTNVKGNIEVTAEFECKYPQYTLTYQASEGGRIEGKASQNVMDGRDADEVTAVADEGYAFKRWSDGVTQPTRKDTNVTGNIDVTAEFVRTYNVIYAAGEGGILQGETSQKIMEGDDTSEVTAIANQGYAFKRWSDGVTEPKRKDINVTENIYVKAEFVRAYNLTFTAGEGGTLQGEISQVVIAGASSTAVTAIPNTGYIFSRWEYEIYGTKHYCWTETITANSRELDYLPGMMYKAIFEKSKHTFGEWITVREPQGEVDGLKKRICSECEYAEEQTIHAHKFSTDWTYDDTYHWHIATCEHSDKISGKNKHTFGEWITVREPQGEIDGLKKRICSECEYAEEQTIHAHKFSTDWTYDDTYHWHAATCEHSDKINEKAPHEIVGRKCICGFEIGTNGLKYELNSDGESYCLADIGTAFESDIIIVSKYNGKPVTSIGDSAFAGCNNLTSVIIPNSVIEIGEKAFYDCTTLTNITIPDSVTTIGFSAFYYCNNLKSIKIPFVGAMQNGNRNTHFGYIFGAESYEDNQNHVPTSLEQVNITNGTIIGYRAFYNCNHLISITIPDGIFSIGQEALYGCNSLTDIIIPISVTSIGPNAFKGCPIKNVTMPSLAIEYIEKSNLNTVVITNGASIDDNAFSGCSSLTSVIIPDSVTSIGNSAFSGCSSLTSVTIPDGVTSIGNSAFSGCNKLYSITIPFVGAALDTTQNTHFGYIFGASSSGDNSKYVPSSLTEVIITGGTSIGNAAFYGCNKLTNITISNSVTGIEDNAFYNCGGLTNIYYTGDITDWCGISGLSNLMSIRVTLYICSNIIEGDLIIPNGVTSIGDYAFFNCSGITSITLPNSVTYIGKSAFYACSISSINIPDSVTSIGERAFGGCSSLTSITIPFVGATLDATQNTNFGYIFGASSYSWNSVAVPHSLKEVIITSGTNIGSYAFSGCSDLISVTIPDSVTSIGSYAFDGCSSLMSVTIPNTITSIGFPVFSNCSNLLYNNYDNALYLGNDNNHYIILIKAINTHITSCDIYSSAKIIYGTAFYNCNNLTHINIPDSVTSIGDSAFYSCDSLINITIPNGVTSIGDSAFYSCDSLINITIPNGVTSIGDYAFCSCNSLLNVTIPDSVTNIGNSAFSRCGSLTSILIGNNVSSIGYDAFYGCYKLAEIYNLSSFNIEKGSSSYGYVGYYAKIIHTLVDEESKISLAEDGYTFVENEDGNVYLIGYNGSETELTLPNNHNGKSYSVNDYTFYGCSDLTSITIPDGLTSIGKSAFSGCSSLTSVILPDSVTSIGYGAFSNCGSLTRITIPFIGANKNDTSNTPFGYIFGASTNNDNSKYVPTSLMEVIITGGTSICPAAFYGCNMLMSITIPNSLTSIGNNAFGECYRLVEVYNLSPLSIVAGSYNNGDIGRYAKVIHTSIVEESIISTTDDGYIFIEDNNGYIYLVGYNGNNKELMLPDKFNDKSYAINKYAFYNCSSLSSVTIPDCVTSIDDCSFYSCSSLKSVTIGNRVTSIGTSAFRGCSRLTNITIPDSVTNIGESAFSSCDDLTSVTMSNSVTSIGNSAFYNCSRLQYNTYDNAKYLGDDNNPYLVLIKANNTYITSCNIHSCTKVIGGYAFSGCNNLTNIYYTGNISDWCGISGLGNLMSYDRTLYINGEKLTGDLVIPDTVTIINDYAFYCCMGLTSVMISNSVTSIGRFAFLNCGLRSVTIPSSVISIGADSFTGCSGFNIYYEGEITDWCNIRGLGNLMSSRCTLYISGEELTGDLVIPDSVNIISDFAFSACSNLTSITIPNSVTSIGDSAFNGCTSLSTFYIESAEVANLSSIGQFLQYATDVYILADIELTASIYEELYDSNGEVVVNDKTYIYYKIKGV